MKEHDLDWCSGLGTRELEDTGTARFLLTVLPGVFGGSIWVWVSSRVNLSIMVLSEGSRLLIRDVSERRDTVAGGDQSVV
jgi:hypothetical protein